MASQPSSQSSSSDPAAADKEEVQLRAALQKFVTYATTCEEIGRPAPDKPLQIAAANRWAQNRIAELVAADKLATLVKQRAEAHAKAVEDLSEQKAVAALAAQLAREQAAGFKAAVERVEKEVEAAKVIAAQEQQLLTAAKAKADDDVTQARIETGRVRAELEREVNEKDARIADKDQALQQARDEAADLRRRLHAADAKCERLEKARTDDDLARTENILSTLHTTQTAANEVVDGLKKHTQHLEEHVASAATHATNLQATAAQTLDGLKGHSANVAKHALAVSAHANNLRTHAAAARDHAEVLGRKVTSAGTHVTNLRAHAAAAGDHVEVLGRVVTSADAHVAFAQRHTAGLGRLSNNLAERIITVDGHVTKLRHQIEAAEAHVVKAQSHTADLLVAVNTSQTAATEALDGLVSQSSNLAEHVLTTENHAAHLSRQIEAVEAHTAKLVGFSNGLAEHVSAASDHTAGLHRQIEAAEAHVISAENHITNLAEYVSAAGDHTASLHRQIEAGKAHVASAENHTTNLVNLSTNLAQHVSAAGDHTASLHHQIEAAEAHVTSAENHTTNLLNLSTNLAEHVSAAGDHAINLHLQIEATNLYVSNAQAHVANANSHHADLVNHSTSLAEHVLTASNHATSLHRHVEAAEAHVVSAEAHAVAVGKNTLDLRNLTAALRAFGKDVEQHAAKLQGRGFELSDNIEDLRTMFIEVEHLQHPMKDIFHAAMRLLDRRAAAITEETRFLSDEGITLARNNAQAVTDLINNMQFYAHLFQDTHNELTTLIQRLTRASAVTQLIPVVEDNVESAAQSSAVHSDMELSFAESSGASSSSRGSPDHPSSVLVERHRQAPASPVPMPTTTTSITTSRSSLSSGGPLPPPDDEGAATGAPIMISSGGNSSSSSSSSNPERPGFATPTPARRRSVLLPLPATAESNPTPGPHQPFWSAAAASVGAAASAAQPSAAVRARSTVARHVAAGHAATTATGPVAAARAAASQQVKRPRSNADPPSRERGLKHSRSTGFLGAARLGEDVPEPNSPSPTAARAHARASARALGPAGLSRSAVPVPNPRVSSTAIMRPPPPPPPSATTVHQLRPSASTSSLSNRPQWIGTGGSSARVAVTRAPRATISTTAPALRGPSSQPSMAAPDSPLAGPSASFAVRVAGPMASSAASPAAPPASSAGSSFAGFSPSPAAGPSFSPSASFAPLLSSPIPSPPVQPMEDPVPTLGSDHGLDTRSLEVVTDDDFQGQPECRVLHDQLVLDGDWTGGESAELRLFIARQWRSDRLAALYRALDKAAANRRGSSLNCVVKECDHRGTVLQVDTLDRQQCCRHRRGANLPFSSSVLCIRVEHVNKEHPGTVNGEGHRWKLQLRR